MLLEFGIKNFFSFKEGASISFKLDKNCPINFSHGKDFSTILAVKGANASGKTQILKGLSFLGWFCSSSFLQKPDESIFVLPYSTSKKPCELYAEFKINDVTYRYEISTTQKEVKREVIYRTKGRRTKILERKNNEITFLIGELDQLKKIILRKNASIISTTHQYGFKELDDLYNFFNQIISNVTFGGLSEANPSLNVVSVHMHKDPSLLIFVKTFIEKCDVGISDIKILSHKKEDDVDEYFPVFFHDIDGNKYPILRQTESSGTKMLFSELPRYQLVLSSGGVLVLDEFDRHLHPHILPKLLQLFEDPSINKKNAQLLFTTHNSDILNYLGRYRVYLVNKEDNASFAYRIDEIPGDILRNDRPILPVYNDGKIGGVPII